MCSWNYDTRGLGCVGDVLQIGKRGLLISEAAYDFLANDDYFLLDVAAGSVFSILRGMVAFT
jgi:hypothetical protein